MDLLSIQKTFEIAELLKKDQIPLCSNLPKRDCSGFCSYQPGYFGSSWGSECQLREIKGVIIETFCRFQETFPKETILNVFFLYYNPSPQVKEQLLVAKDSQEVCEIIQGQVSSDDRLTKELLNKANLSKDAAVLALKTASDFSVSGAGAKNQSVYQRSIMEILSQIISVRTTRKVLIGLVVIGLFSILYSQGLGSKYFSYQHYEKLVNDYFSDFVPKLQIPKFLSQAYGNSTELNPSVSPETVTAVWGNFWTSRGNSTLLFDKSSPFYPDKTMTDILQNPQNATGELQNFRLPCPDFYSNPNLEPSVIEFLTKNVTETAQEYVRLLAESYDKATDFLFGRLNFTSLAPSDTVTAWAPMVKLPEQISNKATDFLFGRLNFTSLAPSDTVTAWAPMVKLPEQISNKATDFLFGRLNFTSLAPSDTVTAWAPMVKLPEQISNQVSDSDKVGFVAKAIQAAFSSINSNFVPESSVQVASEISGKEVTESYSDFVARSFGKVVEDIQERVNSLFGIEDLPVKMAEQKILSAGVKNASALHSDQVSVFLDPTPNQIIESLKQFTGSFSNNATEPEALPDISYLISYSREEMLKEIRNIISFTDTIIRSPDDIELFNLATERLAEIKNFTFEPPIILNDSVMSSLSQPGGAKEVQTKLTEWIYATFKNHDTLLDSLDKLKKAIKDADFPAELNKDILLNDLDATIANHKDQIKIVTKISKKFFNSLNVSFGDFAIWGKVYQLSQDYALLPIKSLISSMFSYSKEVYQACLKFFLAGVYSPQLLTDENVDQLFFPFAEFTRYMVSGQTISGDSKKFLEFLPTLKEVWKHLQTNLGSIDPINQIGVTEIVLNYLQTSNDEKIRREAVNRQFAEEVARVFGQIHSETKEEKQAQDEIVPAIKSQNLDLVQSQENRLSKFFERYITTPFRTLLNFLGLNWGTLYSVAFSVATRLIMASFGIITVPFLEGLVWGVFQQLILSRICLQVVSKISNMIGLRPFLKTTLAIGSNIVLNMMVPQLVINPFCDLYNDFSTHGFAPISLGYLSKYGKPVLIYGSSAVLTYIIGSVDYQKFPKEIFGERTTFKPQLPTPQPDSRKLIGLIDDYGKKSIEFPLELAKVRSEIQEVELANGPAKELRDWIIDGKYEPFVENCPFTSYLDPQVCNYVLFPKLRQRNPSEHELKMITESYFFDEFGIPKLDLPGRMGESFFSPFNQEIVKEYLSVSKKIFNQASVYQLYSQVAKDDVYRGRDLLAKLEKTYEGLVIYHSNLSWWTRRQKLSKMFDEIPSEESLREKFDEEWNFISKKLPLLFFSLQNSLFPIFKTAKTLNDRVLMTLKWTGYRKYQKSIFQLAVAMGFKSSFWVNFSRSSNDSLESSILGTVPYLRKLYLSEQISLIKNTKENLADFIPQYFLNETTDLTPSQLEDINFRINLLVRNLSGRGMVQAASTTYLDYETYIDILEAQNLPQDQISSGSRFEKFSGILTALDTVQIPAKFEIYRLLIHKQFRFLYALENMGIRLFIHEYYPLHICLNRLTQIKDIQPLVEIVVKFKEMLIDDPQPTNLSATEKLFHPWFE